ncbi:MAG: hypothetical protein OSB07_04905 [Dehalococcoidia bacterium]|nr:hypothetical protein [Dehalococcoidia bacterium]
MNRIWKIPYVVVGLVVFMLACGEDVRPTLEPGSGPTVSPTSRPTEKITTGALQTQSPIYEIESVWGNNPAFEVSFTSPNGIAIDSQGNFFVSEVDNSQVQIFSPEGDYIAELAPGILSSPHGLSFDSQGNLYVADTGNNSVNKFTLAN